MEVIDKERQRIISHCWKCKTRLVLKKMKAADYGLYCVKCSRFRRFNVKVPEEMMVSGCFSRVDVRRSGKYKRRVFLGEII